MTLTLTFAPSQNQTFSLRSNYGTRQLSETELADLIDRCEQQYINNDRDYVPDLVQLGRQLYTWLDGPEGWIRKALAEDPEQTLMLDLIQTSEVRGLNPKTERVALGLAHLPWELLHDGNGFLLERQDGAISPTRLVQQRQTTIAPQQNRPLRVLFMATSPEYPGIDPLQFEREEANILQATQDHRPDLVVEESGSTDELKSLVASYPADHFDVFHLTGHGLIYTQQYDFLLKEMGRSLPDHTPCFVTEDELGGLQLTTVSDLAKAFGNRFPRAIFLSGCHTGQMPNQGTVPSMAEALVKSGAPLVLGWARPVYDRTGIVAAQAFYKALATGESVESAVRSARREMIEQECPDWHLLRVYRDSRSVAELVTPLRTKGREKLKLKPAEQDYLDEKGIIKVASREEFVGRRRALQRCLRTLKETSDQVGVWIAGMGGLGKSTLAARLCTRVRTQRPEMEQAVIIGPVDETVLLQALSSKYERYEVPLLR